MISTKTSIVIGVVILVVFGSMAYLTIEKSSSGSSITAGNYRDEHQWDRVLAAFNSEL